LLPLLRGEKGYISEKREVVKESEGKVRTEGKGGYFRERGRERNKKKTGNEVLEQF
jgi:hypothetical protein